MQPPDTIRKLHALATHPATPEHERAQARKALDRLMTKWNLTEEDLTSEVRTKFITWSNGKAAETLVYHVIFEALGRARDTNVMAYRGEKRGSVKFICHWTLVEAADFQACYGWYEQMLLNDLAAQRRRLKEVRADATKKINFAKAALKEIPQAFVAKYEIGYAALLADREIKERIASENAARGAERKGLTGKQKKRQSESDDAYWAAKDGLADGSRWEKPVGNMGGGVKELANGDVFQLTND